MHESEKRKKSLSRVQLLATPWTAAHQAPPSMGFSRQEYWSGVPLPSPQVVLEVKNPPANAGDTRDMSFIPESRRSPGVGNATHSSILALKIPCTEESGRLLPMGPKESDANEHTHVRVHTHTHARARLV